MVNRPAPSVIAAPIASCPRRSEPCTTRAPGDWLSGIVKHATRDGDVLLAAVEATGRARRCRGGCGRPRLVVAGGRLRAARLECEKQG